VKISFHGAARGVTGSCHLIECGGRRVLIDCGLYQGGRELQEENAEDFGFDPSQIDVLLLTHAHLDHCGRIPLLSKRGFRGEIVTTAASRELARLVLMDSAHLQEEEARYQARRWARRGRGRRKPAEPLYSVLDTLASTEHFGRTASYGHPIEVVPGVVATFHDAGHILGSAFICLELREGKSRRTVLFSGDLGGEDRPFLRGAAWPPEADVVVMETTYGDRLHQKLGPSVEELYRVVNDTFQRGGNVIVPTFALERAQELLFFIREGVESGKLPGSIQVFLDSPMAISATQIYERHPECFDQDIARLFGHGKDPFTVPGLHFTKETADSIALNRFSGGAVILAGSGMCTGGRVRHHLRHNLGRRQSSVIFVGFAAIGTLARKIIDGAREVRIFGESVKVHAAIHTINGFSAHADQAALLAWLAHAGRPEQVFLVHGEEHAMRGIKDHIEVAEVSMPVLHQRFDL
jgi:metallo-beta-lactamase family protein